MTHRRYLRARQIAVLLDQSERTVRRWIRDGTLPSCKIGGARLVGLAELERRFGAPLDLLEEDDDETQS